jgi:protein TonB
VVEVALVAQGESAESQTPVDEVVPAAPPPSPTPAEAQPAPELSAPPPAVAEAEALPLAPPKADAAPKETAKNENGPDRSEQKQPPPPKKAPARPDLSERRQTAREARQEARRGAKTGVASGGLSRASYASLVSAEINRRRFYPSAARASGASGEVGVAFTIGPSGRVVRYAITYSSGSSALDGAARSILAAIHAPPPPGGSFAANTSIRFHLD